MPRLGNMKIFVQRLLSKDFDDICDNWWDTLVLLLKEVVNVLVFVDDDNGHSFVLVHCGHGLIMQHTSLAWTPSPIRLL